MISMFILLAFIVLIGYVANVEMAVFRKIENQNAVDSMSQASTQWMARNMNAITANNHLLGELSAITILIEGLGGPELDGKAERNSDSVGFDNSFRKYPSAVYIGSLGVARLTDLDRQFLEKCQSIFFNDNGEHDSGAAILDAQLHLKSLVVYGMRTKQISNLLYLSVAWIPLPGVELAAATLNLLVHTIVDGAIIVGPVKDWYLLKGLEIVASGLQPLRSTALPLAMQALSMYGDSLNDQVRLRRVIQETLDEAKTKLGVQEYRTFPLVERLNLPVRIEEPPDGERPGTRPPSFSTRKPREDDVIKALKIPLREIKSTIARIESMIPRIPLPFGGSKPLYSPFADVRREIEKLIPAEAKRIPREKGGGFGFESNISFENLDDYVEESKLDWEKEQYSQWVRSTYPHVDQIRRPIRGFFHTFVRTSQIENFYTHWTNRYTPVVSHRLRSNLGGIPGTKNPLAGLEDKLREFRRRLDKLKAEFNEFLEGAITEEEELRNRLEQLSKGLRDLGDFVSGAGIKEYLQTGNSDIDGWLSEVTNHVQQSKELAREDLPFDPDIDQEVMREVAETIALINYIGYLLDDIDALLQRIEDLIRFGPPHMYVMKDSTPESKGNESWTSSPSSAERIFTILVFTKSEVPDAILTPPLYPNPSQRGLYAVSQAMVYNGNGRDMDGATNDQVQPNTGWDTLNWAPPVSAPEWQSQDSDKRDSSMQEFIDAFSKGIKTGDKNSIRLNWNSKLVPISKLKLDTSMKNSDIAKFLKDGVIPDTGLIKH